MFDAEPRTARHVADATSVIRGEFKEMPCLSLTLRQAMRLWSLDEVSCARSLDALRREGFLRVTADGVYRRATE